MSILLLHLLGDYVLQSNWMAQRKTSSLPIAGLHAVLYSLPFLLVTGWFGVGILITTHMVIDRFRLARYIIWVKNLMCPRQERVSWETCKATGYSQDTPPWLSTWLMILVDNAMHLAIASVVVNTL